MLHTLRSSTTCGYHHVAAGERGHGAGREGESESLLLNSPSIFR
jgi:hypothetical protein